MVEDPADPELEAQTALDAQAALVRAETLAELTLAGCLYPDLWAPSIEKQLRAVHIGDGVGYKVLGVDSKGNVRTGPTGPMTARQVVDLVIDDTPEFFAKRKR